MKNALLIFGISATSMFSSYGQNTCAEALPVTAGTYSLPSINGSQVPTPICATGGPGATAGMWYKYTPSESLEITVTTDFPAINGNIDNRVNVYDGTCTALNCVAGDDDSGTNELCVVTFNATANTDYFIAFDNRWTSAGFTFELIENELPPAPTITFTSQTYSNISGQYKIAIADMNGDYLDDIVSVSSTFINILYQQNDGTFQATTINTTNAQFLPTWSLAIGDVNKDGFND